MHNLAQAFTPVLPMLMLAQIPTEANAAVIVLAGITFLTIAANQLLQMRDRLGKHETPSVKIEPDLHKEYRDWIRIVEKSVPATEQLLRSEMKAETDQLQQRVDTLHVSMNSQFNHIAGKIGRIAGRLGLPEETEE